MRYSFYSSQALFVVVNGFISGGVLKRACTQ